MTESTALCEIHLVNSVATEAKARRLAHAVLQARLAACAQVDPITAYFRWQGALEEDRELRVVFMTVPSAVPALPALVRAQHPYTLPQLAVQPLQASAEYGGWADQQVVDAAGLPA